MFDSCRNLTYNMTHEIGIRIIRGVYCESNNFPTEAALSAEFGVSRNVTREAIKILAAKGLIASRPRKGISVMPTSNWNLFDSDILHWTIDHAQTSKLYNQLQQLRLAIEPEAIRIICFVHDQATIGQIGLNLQKMKHHKNSRQRFSNAQINFHQFILASCNNPYFEGFNELIAASIRFDSEGYDAQDLFIERIISLYENMVDGLYNNEPAISENLYRDILEVSFSRQ